MRFLRLTAGLRSRWKWLEKSQDMISSSVLAKHRETRKCPLNVRIAQCELF